MSGDRTGNARPGLTWVVVGTALVCSMAPGFATVLEYDRARVAADGEWWRLLTSQLVHWTPRMVFFDLGVIALLGIWAERRFPEVTRLSILGVFPSVGLVVHLGMTHLSTYRGASGLAVALFALVGLKVLLHEPGRATRIAAAAILGLLAAKLAVEAWTGRALFAGSLPEGVSVASLVHVVGATVAVVTVLVERLVRLQKRSSRVS